MVIMKKKVIMRAMLGCPLGIAVSYIFTIIISIVIGDGKYYPCTPDLIVQTGSQLNAVLLQTVLSALLGAGCAGSSVIWEMEEWSILKQTGIYFLIIAMLMMGVAYKLYWMQHTVGGFIQYFSIFLIIFVTIWLTQRFYWKMKIKRMNQQIKKNRF